MVYKIINQLVDISEHIILKNMLLLNNKCKQENNLNQRQMNLTIEIFTAMTHLVYSDYLLITFT